MFPYLPHTSSERKALMEKIGIESIDELFADISEDAKFNRRLNINRPYSELEVKKICRDIGRKNHNLEDYVCFVGAGFYDHYIPSVVDHVLMRSEFYTAYTPYQAEMSQGYLQAIFEYQTMICELTGMEVSNASMYDGASATAEAGLMAVNISRKRNTVLISKTIHPETQRVCRTYLENAGVRLIEIEAENGVTSLKDLEAKLDTDTAAVICQYPNFFGIVENLADISDRVHANESLMIINSLPIALGLLKTPASLGADIAVGEGQSLGNPINFGGPGLGYFATKEKFVRYMPGRIVGETVDNDGNRGYVLTLQSREQHIRRQKATSNICSNQALNALAASVYLAAMGRKGIRKVAESSFRNTHYLADRIGVLKKFSLRFDKLFFNEFVVHTEHDVDHVLEALRKNNILGGYKLGNDYPGCFLVAVTEKRTKEELDQYIKVLEGLE